MPVLQLPAPTAEEQAAEDFDPLPLIAPALQGDVVFPFKLGLPSGDGKYTASWENETQRELLVNQGAIRYTQEYPPHFLSFGRPIALLPGDILAIHYTPGGKR
jgi:hypothetical protein